MFAIAIWDARARRLVLARDRFGIKPLYYRAADAELSFASELDALPKGELDFDALEAFLAFNSVPAPLSIFREIRKLPPGHLLTWTDGRVVLDRYARVTPLPARRDEDEAELLEECRARLRDSVRAHLVSDMPVGVLLSPPRRARSRCAHSRSASKRRPSTSSQAHARSPRSTGLSTGSSC
jgi:asparagine synthase (glutamine-hydrolysing)